MPKLVTIECDPHEVRIAIGNSGLTGISVDHVLSRAVTLAEGEEILSGPTILGTVRALLRDAGVRSGDAIVCIGRSRVELQSLTLPTTDPNELPDMVRFAAQRHFANMGDTWPIDFVTIPSTQPGSSECLAASVNPALIERLSKVIESVGLTLTRVVLKSMVSTTMALAKLPELATSSVAFVDILRDEADIVVAEKGHVVFMRTFRFSENGSVDENYSLLASEIKRTLLAASSQRIGLNVEQVRIWGKDDVEHYCDGLSKSINLPVSSLDPIGLVDATANARKEAGTNTGRFAPVLGALYAPIYTQRLIDFTNPRKRTEKKVPYARYALIAAAIATVVGGGWLWHWSSHGELDVQIAELKAGLEAEKDSLQIAAKNVADWKTVENFLKGDYHWLNELAFMSEKSLDTDKAYFSVATFSLEPRSGVGSISTKFYALEPELVPAVQAAIRNPSHVVKNRGVTPNQDKARGYPWVADLTVQVAQLTSVDPRKDEAPKADVPKTEAVAKKAVEENLQKDPASSPTVDATKAAEKVDNADSTSNAESKAIETAPSTPPESPQTPAGENQ